MRESAFAQQALRNGLSMWGKKSKRPIQAAASEINRRALNRRGTSVQTWQAEIAGYVKNGPGLVGEYCDLVEDKILTAAVRFECEQSDGSWELMRAGTARNISLGVYNAFRNPYQEPAALIARMARLHVSMGEAFHIGVPRYGKMERYVAHIRELESWVLPQGGNPGSVVWRDPYTGLKHRIYFPTEDFGRSWWGEDDDPSLPVSELRRALPHIRELIDLRRRSRSDSRSRLANNDMLAFGQGTEVYENTADLQDPLNGLPQAIIDYIDLASLEFNTPYWAQPPITETVPFPMLGEAPTKVEIGRPLEEEQGAHETQALIHIAHALRLPNRWLLEGPGSGKYNNESSLSAAVIDDAIGPVAFRVYADFTSLYFRPRLQRVLAAYPHLAPGLDPTRVRVSADLDSIRPKPDHILDAFKAWDRALISRDNFATITQFDPMPTPSGMSDWELWQITQGLAQGAGAGGSRAAERALSSPGNSGGTSADRARTSNPTTQAAPAEIGIGTGGLVPSPFRELPPKRPS